MIICRKEMVASVKIVWVIYSTKSCSRRAEMKKNIDHVLCILFFEFIFKYIVLIILTCLTFDGF